ncbi:MAG: type II toxin-antitoxin system VapC family toxin [Paludibacteraceae bacterium]|nr:type II toxin-antitoxin system VapC family toxin [Paludibacteraceae bacterium]
MRYLLDTNIFVYSTIDVDSLSKDVRAILEDYDNTFCISSESVKELIVAYRNKGLGVRYWKTPEAMVKAIEDDYGIVILPIAKEHMLTYARLQLNEAQGHKDPSDHIIIAQAITEHIPLISSDTRFPFYRAQGLDLVFNTK